VSETVHKSYTFYEELVNSISHGIGLLLSVAGLTLMILLAGDNNSGSQLASAIIFGSSLILMYLASTLYHAIVDIKAKSLLKLLDHCAIYVLIAGTYTPFLLLSLEGLLAYSMLISIWCLAVFGIIFKILYRHKHPKLSLATYLAMGWLVVVITPSMLDTVPQEGLVLLAAGGLAYTVGAIFYALKNLPHSHGIWHTFVLAGSICHFLSIYLYVMN